MGTLFDQYHGPSRCPMPTDLNVHRLRSQVTKSANASVVGDPRFNGGIAKMTGKYYEIELDEVDFLTEGACS